MSVVAEFIMKTPHGIRTNPEAKELLNIYKSLIHSFEDHLGIKQLKISIVKRAVANGQKVFQLSFTMIEDRVGPVDSLETAATIADFLIQFDNDEGRYTLSSTGERIYGERIKGTLKWNIKKARTKRCTKGMRRIPPKVGVCTDKNQIAK